MKKILLISLCVLATNAVTYAQRKGLWIAPQASIGAGKLTNFKVVGEADPYFSLNFNAGADIYYMFTENFGAGTGLSLGVYGSEWKGTFNGQKVNYIMGHSNLDTPLFVRFSSSVRYGFFAQAGFLYSRVIKAVQEVVTEDNNETLLKVDGDDARRDFRSSTFYPFVYLGAEFKCGDRVNISAGPYLQYQLGNDFAKQTPMSGQYLILGGKIAVGIQAAKGN